MCVCVWCVRDVCVMLASMCACVLALRACVRVITLSLLCKVSYIEPLVALGHHKC